MPLNVVLFQPEIPQNTGNIMRTAVGTNAKLHLIEPFGFKLDEKSLKRSHLDYGSAVDYQIYPDWETFLHLNPGNYYFLSRHGKKSPDAFDFSDPNQDFYFVFGRESTGLPKELLSANKERLLRLPMTDKIRSLNLANTVCVVLYEALRQQGYPNLELAEPLSLKGPNWLDQD
ncbi:MAG: tRNA (cytidine(34)-2'-O)-methyltransferase [Candidatus Izemoplasmatales bacterium]|nr:tRNA (cytidine(34)-2'-O)-methyltransferase [Candidatus Izemoplasmatales bacterium]